MNLNTNLLKLKSVSDALLALSLKQGDVFVTSYASLIQFLKTKCVSLFGLFLSLYFTSSKSSFYSHHFYLSFKSIILSIYISISAFISMSLSFSLFIKGLLSNYLIIFEPRYSHHSFGRNITHRMISLIILIFPKHK